jgi:hypothetical protein
MLTLCAFTRFVATILCVPGQFPLLGLGRIESASELDLQELIENVRSNEGLYEDIEIVAHKTYQLKGSSVQFQDGFREITREDARIRDVRQKELFRFEREGQHSYPDGGRQSIDRVRAFDGKTTRLYDQNTIGNLIIGRSEDNFLRPHMILLDQIVPMVPLSTYLKGHVAIAAHPNSNWNADLITRTEYRGEGEWAGLKCQKVSLTTVVKGTGHENDSWEFWLAEDRNYLPVRLLGYTFRFSKDVPVGVGALEDLREIEPGIWFPNAAHFTAYDQDLLAREQKQKERWRREYAIQEVSLKPNYDTAFFQNVPFPDGTAVYEIENGKIARSYYQGAPDAPGGPTSSMNRWWLLWTNIGLLILVATVLACRRVLMSNPR